jgi:hypothetical protein
MNRVTLFIGRDLSVAIVFLCMTALALIQILGPTARLNHDYKAGDLSQPGFVTLAVQGGAAHSPLPNRCAAIKLAPIEIKTTIFAPTGDNCGLVTAYTPILPKSAEPGVPTPPPRGA